MQLTLSIYYIPKEAEMYATNLVTAQGKDCIKRNSGPGLEIIQIIQTNLN